MWQRQRTHSQHVCVYVRGIQQTGDWLHKDKESDDHQEQAIDESREYFNTTVPEGRKKAGVSIQKHPSAFFKTLFSDSNSSRFYHVV